MKSVYGTILSVVVATLVMSCQTLPEGVRPAMATWLYGYHSLPSTVAVSGDIESFRNTEEEPLWSEQAEKGLKPGTKNQRGQSPLILSYLLDPLE